MKYKKLKLSTVLLLSLGLTGLQAQEAILASGGDASGSGGSASYSAGQVFIQQTQVQTLIQQPKEYNSLMKFRLFRELDKQKASILNVRLIQIQLLIFSL